MENLTFWILTGFLTLTFLLNVSEFLVPAQTRVLKGVWREDPGLVARVDRVVKQTWNDLKDYKSFFLIAGQIRFSTFHWATD